MYLIKNLSHEGIRQKWERRNDVVTCFAILDPQKDLGQGFNGCCSKFLNKGSWKELSISSSNTRDKEPPLVSNGSLKAENPSGRGIFNWLPSCGPGGKRFNLKKMRAKVPLCCQDSPANMLTHLWPALELIIKLTCGMLFMIYSASQGDYGGSQSL